MVNEKQRFIKLATVLCDTREQKNAHILRAFDRLGIQHEERKLDFGDYSFLADGRDFSMSCVVERKGSVNELWTNTTKDRERFEKELSAAHQLNASVNLLLEGCAGWDALRAYMVPEHEMKYQHRQVQDIGAHIYNTLQAWTSHNRYGIAVHFVENEDAAAACMLNVFFWYWHNYKQLLRPIQHRPAPRSKNY